MTGWQKEQKFVQSRYAIQLTQINREIDEMEKLGRDSNRRDWIYWGRNDDQEMILESFLFFSFSKNIFKSIYIHVSD